MSRELSNQAAAAKAIRKELKAAFPTIKFSVTSRSFAGGDDVSVGWVDGPSNDAVNKIIGKYQYGSFDISSDMYEYTNTRSDIPQVKYVQTQRNESACLVEWGREMLKEVYGWSKLEDNEWIEDFKAWGRTVIYRYLQPISFC